jgi:hypothetical protein
MPSFVKAFPRNDILDKSRFLNTLIALLLVFESTELNVFVLTPVMGLVFDFLLRILGI